MSKSLNSLRAPGKQHPYRVRVREKKNSFRTAFLSGRNPKKVAKGASGGRILSVTKVSMEELLKVGSFFRLGKQLMDEFRKEENNGKSPVSRVRAPGGREESPGTKATEFGGEGKGISGPASSD